MSKPYMRPSTVEDCAELALTMRQADLTEIALSGSPGPYDSLMRGVVASDDPTTVIGADGTVVAMLGVVRMGPSLGSPWMLASDGLEDIKWPFLRECRKWLAGALKRYQSLHHHVWEGNALHIRWLQWLGFTVSPVPLDRPHFLPFWKSNNHV